MPPPTDTHLSHRQTPTFQANAHLFEGHRKSRTSHIHPYPASAGTESGHRVNWVTSITPLVTPCPADSFAKSGCLSSWGSPNRLGKVSHEKTHTATRSVKHACSISMLVFLLFLLLDSDEFVGVWIPDLQSREELTDLLCSLGVLLRALGG